jgi:thiamine biosynthesis lipoprotein
MCPATVRLDVTTLFQAMASPCVVLVDTADTAAGARVGQLVKDEALRVEAKYSRYRPSVVTTINESAGREVEVDPETADLIDYAVSCYELSDGRFDITSGALRRVWRFDRCGAPPDPARVSEILSLVGWHRVSWKRPRLRLAPGMEIDLGGIGKEYAVDRALLLAAKLANAPMLINFGGDLRVSGARRDGSSWRVAIEHAEQAGASAGLLELTDGAIATSGDTYRHVMIDGVRYGHVLDPRTGWPIPGAPRSVTVHAGTCSEAGLLAKLALLRGQEAEEFLRGEQVRAWCFR